MTPSLEIMTKIVDYASHLQEFGLKMNFIELKMNENSLQLKDYDVPLDFDTTTLVQKS